MIDRSAAIGHVAMLTYSALVAFSFTFGALVADDIDPAVLTMLRFVIAGAVLSAIAALSAQSLQNLTQKSWRWLIIGGLSAAYFIAMFEALRLTTPLTTAAVFTLSPLAATGIEYLVNKKRPSWALLASLIIGAIGALWVIFRADFGKFIALELGLGELIFLFGTLCLAAVPALTRRLAPDATPFAAAFGTVLGALLISAIYSTPQIFQTPFASIPTKVWLVASYLGIFTTAATFFLLQVAIPRLTPGKVMAYTYLVPSWVMLHALTQGQFEPARIYIGVAITLFALLLLLFNDDAKRV